MPLFDAGARDGVPSTVHDRVLTVPNLITAVRLAGLPVFVWLVLGPGRLLPAFWLLVAIAATDWVDGYVARRFDQVSRIGKLVDPLVDRALLATVSVTLVIAGAMPLWVLVVIVARDAAVLGTALVWFGGVPPMAVSRAGKAATALLLIGVPGFLLAAADWSGADAVAVISWLATGAGVALYYWAAANYARVALVIRRAREPDDAASG